MAYDQQWLATLCLVTSSVIAVVANLLLVVVFFRRRGLRTVSNRFVINLLITNLLSSVLIIPLLILDQDDPHPQLDGAHNVTSTDPFVRNFTFLSGGGGEGGGEEEEEAFGSFDLVVEDKEDFFDGKETLYVTTVQDSDDKNFQDKDPFVQKELFEEHDEDARITVVTDRNPTPEDLPEKDFSREDVSEKDILEKVLPKVLSEKASSKKVLSEETLSEKVLPEKVSLQKILLKKVQIEKVPKVLSDKNLIEKVPLEKVLTETVLTKKAPSKQEDFSEIATTERNLAEVNPNNQRLNSFLCYFAQSSTSLICTASILSILLIGIDQYFAVMHSLRYHSYVDKFRSLALILASWLTAFLFAAFGALTRHRSTLWNFCSQKTRGRTKGTLRSSSETTVYAFTYFVLVILVPFVAICVIYVCIYTAAHKNSERMRKSTSSQGSSNNNFASAVAAAESPSKDCVKLEGKPLHKVYSAPSFVSCGQTESEFTCLKSDLFGRNVRENTIYNGRIQLPNVLVGGDVLSRQDIRNCQDIRNRQDILSRGNILSGGDILSSGNILKSEGILRGENRSDVILRGEDISKGEVVSSGGDSENDGSEKLGPSNRKEVTYVCDDFDSSPTEEVRDLPSERDPSSDRSRKISRACSERVSTTSGLFNSLRYKISNASIFRYREESRAAKISILVIFMVLVCYLPYGLALLFDSGAFDFLPPRRFNYVSIVLLVTSNLVSPFLFAYRNRRIQRELWKFFGLVPPKPQSSVDAVRGRTLKRAGFKEGESSGNPRNVYEVKGGGEAREPFLGKVPSVVVEVSSEKKSILKRVCSKNWPNYKNCNFITVPESCLGGEGRGSFSSASTQISTEE